jgi:adenylate kinase
VERGELVPDALLLDLIRDRLTQADARDNWILDGFPRNVAQAAFLEELLAEIGQASPSIVNLEVPQEVLIQRLLLRGRKDDSEDTIRRRLEVYQEQTAPLIEYYQDRDKLHSIDGDRAADAVAASLQDLVG